MKSRMKVKTQSKKVNKAWLNDHVNDTYVKLAQKEGYRARAAYKLKEIDEQLGLIKPGQVMVDLGSAPGAWSQYVRRRLSPGRGWGGRATQWLHHRAGRLPMEPVEGVSFLQGDFRGARVLQQLEGAGRGARWMWWCPTWRPTCPGIESADAARIAHLVELAVDFASQHLKPEGALVVKLFHGSGYSELVQTVQGDVSKPSSRSSPRHRATNPPKLFWWASVSNHWLEVNRWGQVNFLCHGA
jgi:23S rRNA (uridine2552-2'-O)-methyltransferase